MNQILDFGVGGGNEGNNNKKEKKAAKKKEKEYNSGGFNGGINDFSGGKSSGGTKSISDKVIKVFVLLMILIAIALIVSGAMSIFSNNDKVEESKTETPVATVVEAEISAKLNEISGKVTITVESTVPIDTMRYSWDKDPDKVVAGGKQMSLEQEVIAPSGEHVLHIKVTDEKNNSTTKDFTFDSATGIDTEQPVIELSFTGGTDGTNKKLQVKVTDDTSIAYVTYAWNEGETVTMTPENEGTQEYTFEVDIPRGKNTIVVTAVDGSDSSNATVAPKVIEALTNPEISYGFLDNEGSVLKIMCSHENGIKKIYYTLNGQPYQWEAGEGEETPKYLEFTQASVVGHNEMTIKVTSVDDTEADFNPVWDYNPTTTEQSAGENTNTAQEGGQQNQQGQTQDTNTTATN